MRPFVCRLSFFLVRTTCLLAVFAGVTTTAFAQHNHTASGLPHGIPDFCASATITSAGSGAWSNPSTWSPARVPTAGDKVSIAHAVTYDVVSDVPLNCV